MAKGPYRDLSLDGMGPEIVLDLYRFMLRLRMCEEALINEYHPADEMRCPIHFCVGQEAAPAALYTLIGADDYLFSHHRSHGYYLAKKAPMGSFFAELYGRAGGANGGFAGSQDISYSPVHFFGGAILSGSVGMATGTALGLQLKEPGKVAVAGFGEGASDEGIFWEALNYAALRKLPVVFICENNLYATYSPQLKRHSRDNISQRVESFGMPARSLFGNDVIAVHRVMQEAMEHARSGQGPFFIEAFTYRWYGHVGPEDDDYLGYRPAEELRFWKDNCPVALLEEPMISSGLLTPALKNSLVKEIDAEIADAFDFAKNSEFPKVDNWEALNYSPVTPLADELLRDSRLGEFDQNQEDAIPKPY